MTETTLQHKIIKALNKVPGVWARANIATGYSGRGNPDIDGCADGRAFYAEVKLPGRNPEPIQQAVLELIKKKGGGKTFVWRSVEEAVSDMNNFLDELLGEPEIDNAREDSGE
jgi:hypothetical protein